jgi:predicted metalloprotease with PDZ domain
MLTLFAAATLASTSIAPRIDTLRYEIAFAREDSSHRTLDIRLRFRLPATGRAVFEVPHMWAAHSDLEKQLSNLRVTAGPSGLVTDTDSTFAKIVTGRPGALVEVNYRLRQDWTGPVRRPEYYRAIVGRHYALLVGQNSLARPRFNNGDSVLVDFTWRNTPANWRIETSFGGGTAQRARMSITELLVGVFVAGEFRSYTTLAYGRPVKMLVYGNWPFTDSALVASTRDVVTREREFWRDRSARPFLVATVPSLGGIGGTAYTNGLVMYADTTSQLPSLTRLLAHETFHQWNGHTIRTAGPEGGMKWLSEGFTEYFADRFARDAGLLSANGYLEKVNENIRQYYTSPVRNATRDDLNRRYWSDPDMNRFPYYQGYLIAGFVDRELRRVTNNRFTVDSLLFSLYRRVRGTSRLVDDATFANAAPPALRAALRDSITSFVGRGHSVPVLSSSFGSCTDVRLTEMFAFDLGFDANASTRSRVMTGVRVGSTADSAGLRDGMRLRGWSWFNGDPTRSASVRVVEGDSVRRIVWLPRGDTSFSVPQVAPCHPDATLSVASRSIRTTSVLKEQ